MKKIQDYIKEKIAKESNFKYRLDLIQQKAKVVSKIIEYRNKYHLSQSQLAERIGVSQQYISKVEEGDFHNLEAIEDILYHIGYRLELNVVSLKHLKTKIA